MTFQNSARKTKCSHLELPVDELSNWDIFNQYAENREDIAPQETPALSAYWTLTAASGDGRFPLTTQERSHMAVPPSSRFIDGQWNETPTLILKLERRNDDGVQAAKQEERGTTRNILHRAHQRASSKSKQAVEKILSHLGTKDGAKTAHHSENHNPHDFHFIMSPTTAHANKLRRTRSQQTKYMVSLPTPLFPAERPVSSPPPMFLTPYTSRMGGFTCEMPLRTAPSSRYAPEPCSGFPTTPYTSQLSGTPVAF